MRLLQVALCLLLSALGAALAQPEPRVDPAIAYDRGTGVVVLYGGESPDGQALGDTWTFDPALGTWDERSPATSPPPLREHLMAYDTANERVVVWGGFSPTGENLELWSYETDANEWVRVEQRTELPPGRVDSDAAYVPSIDRVAVIGGWDVATGPNLGDTWLLDVDHGSWTEVVAEPSMSVRVQHVVAYDPAHDVVVLFGGLTNDGAQGAERVDRVWTFDPHDRTWTERPPRSGPEQTANGRMAALGDGTLLYYGGGPFGSDQAWIYDVAEHAWTPIDAPDPGPLSRFAMIGMPDGTALLFGGQRGWRSDDVRTAVWRFDPATLAWSRVGP